MKLKFDRAVEYWAHNQTHPALTWIWSILSLVVICTLAFLWNLGSTGLIDETEPLFAEAARQMTVTGDYITPYFNGATRFDKPPLVYWLMALAYSIFGVNEWAVRLPSALAAIALTCLGFYTLLNFGVTSPKSNRWFCASLGAALIALNPETIVWARTGVSDMLLSGCMGTALLSFFLGYAQPEKPHFSARWYLAFYVLIALAVLAKGPVGIVLPALIIGAFLLYVGKLRTVLREMRIIWGSLLFTAIALPWYLLVIQANGWNYINAFFGYHNVERFTNVVNNHAAPWYFYFVVVLLGFAPWSIFLPIAIIKTRFAARLHWRHQPRSTHLNLFAFFWFIVIFGFFTISVTKLPSYVLPLMPAAAILVAILWSRSTIKGKIKSDALFRWSCWLNVGFLFLLATALLLLPNIIGTDPAIPNLQAKVQRSGLPVLGCIIWGVSASVGVILSLRRYWRGLLAVNLVGFVAFLIFVIMPTYLFVDQARQLPLRELSAIARQLEPSENLIMIGFKKPSVVFYTQRRVIYIRRAKDATAQLQQIAAKTPTASMLILSYPKNLRRLQLLSPPSETLGKAGAYQLVRVFNQPLNNE